MSEKSYRPVIEQWEAPKGQPRSLRSEVVMRAVEWADAYESRAVEVDEAEYIEKYIDTFYRLLDAVSEYRTAIGAEKGKAEAQKPEGRGPVAQCASCGWRAAPDRMAFSHNEQWYCCSECFYSPRQHYASCGSVNMRAQAAKDQFYRPAGAPVSPSSGEGARCKSCGLRLKNRFAGELWCDDCVEHVFAQAISGKPANPAAEESRPSNFALLAAAGLVLGVWIAVRLRD